ncbi:hypothetical protein LTR84_010317 [Exophiala bonariae]|uniref:C2H2-type domain-containing protein n=1 Tax=Exophiala bonariae TaxID=1690606 RepID=A0AAV9MX78_9EURO|nr:hypothetical protein LTR84_010317 [Exophiala bonariae]
MEFPDSSLSTRNGVTHAYHAAVPLPQQHLVEESQSRMNGPWAIHVDNTYALPMPMPMPTIETQQQGFSVTLNGSTPQSRALNEMLAPLLRHSDTTYFTEAISTYLKLPEDLWQALRLIRESAFSHEILRDGLSQDIWQLMVRLRDEVNFKHLQPLVVTTFVEHATFIETAPTGTSQTHSRSASGASWYESGKQQTGNGASRPALHPSHATSPSLSGFQFSSPVQQEHSMQTRSVTPVSIMYTSSRNTSRSPWRNKKGKAPAGQLYVCPLPNCTKKGFKNVGNYINHMLRLHAGYPRHDPETSLQPESSPSLDGGEEFVSPAATTASNSPLLVRHLSQDLSSFGDVHSSFGQDESNPSAGINRRASDVNPEHFDFSSSIASANGVSDDATEMVDNRPDLYEVEEDQVSSPTDTGGMSFGMFQATILSARRSSLQKRSY